jgi:5,6-dimethylbenzimidazole synthase
MLQGDPRQEKYKNFKLEGIIESSLNICVTYDPTRFGPFVLGRTSIEETGVYSVCCAIQNLWLAARAEGVGVGWVSILDNEELARIVGAPPHVRPIAYLCLGYTSEFSDKPDLEKAGWIARMNLSDVICYEKWTERREGEQTNEWTELSRAVQNEQSREGNI